MKVIQIIKTALLTCSVITMAMRPVMAGQDEQPVPEFIEENDQCLRCHGHSNFEYYNPDWDQTVTEFMCEHRRVDSATFYQSNHGTFSCFDCHSPDYETFPHPGELRLEKPWGCIDCHGYDEQYAQFHFEDIQLEYEKSIHAEVMGDEFSCWSCHNAHTYTTTAREEEDIRKTVAYNNSICLSCHSDFDRFQLLTDREEINILETHDWLPNQSLHFRAVRCIECHAETNDSILVAHHIKPKEEAVQKCVECHSTNSILMASLYKHQVAEKRSELGFINGVLIEDYYVMGANRNYYLNVLSVIIFILVLGGIAIHATLRVISKKKQ